MTGYDKYLNDLLVSAKNDSEKRLNAVSKDLIEIVNKTYGVHETYKDKYFEVVSWMLRLFRANETTSYSLFKGVMRNTSLNTLGGLEELRSFVGNFFDDSGCYLEIEPREILKTPFKDVVLEPSPILHWHIRWAKDDNWMDEKELVDIMKKAYQADYEWMTQFSNNFGPDRKCNSDLFDMEFIDQKKEEKKQ